MQYIDRVVLLSGDGDFYTSLGFVRNALRKEVWVVGRYYVSCSRESHLVNDLLCVLTIHLGFCGTVSGDLQQLSTRLIWINDLWGRVKYQAARRASGAARLSPADIYGCYLQMQSTRQPTHRSQRRRHSRPYHERRERHESDDDLHGTHARCAY